MAHDEPISKTRRYKDFRRAKSCSNRSHLKSLDKCYVTLSAAKYVLHIFTPQHFKVFLAGNSKPHFWPWLAPYCICSTVNGVLCTMRKSARKVIKGTFCYQNMLLKMWGFWMLCHDVLTSSSTHSYPQYQLSIAMEYIFNSNQLRRSGQIVCLGTIGAWVGVSRHLW